MSNTDTQEYLKTLSFPFQYLSEKDIGIYDAMNKGISLSTGKWLYFLGSGDVLEDKDVLEKVFSKPYSDDISLISGKIIYEGETIPFIYNKNKKVKNPSWNFSMWIRNGLHHQGTFYKKDLFKEQKYSLKYPIFSDYWFNILLFKKNSKCMLSDVLIAKCNSDGVSKIGDWISYKEEIRLKVALSSKILVPFFYMVILPKYFLRQIINSYS
ncbi:putative slime polysaccharide biosynthesis glycosyl transferase, GT2 family [Polaribacter sp. Hel1_85]|nr:putative slime polysaccharide biosynthesis glycosyl transferase, GT2 family [Polaribacter sp. Hel1_85]